MIRLSMALGFIVMFIPAWLWVSFMVARDFLEAKLEAEFKESIESEGE